MTNVTSKNSEIIDEDDISISYAKIYLNICNINPSEELIDEYLTFDFGTDTTTGKVVRDGDSYQYIITDSVTGKSRTYDIEWDTYYTDEYSVTSVQSTDEDILQDVEMYNDAIEIYGAKDSLEEMLPLLTFKCGENVISQEIEKQRAKHILY